MKPPNRLVRIRVVSVVALALAVAIPWLGWWALAALAAVLLLGTLTGPRRAPHAHVARIRVLFEAAQRRVRRHPWRLKRL